MQAAPLLPPADVDLLRASRAASPSLVVVRRGDSVAPHPPAPSSRRRPRIRTLSGLGDTAHHREQEPTIPRMHCATFDSWESDLVLVNWDDEPYVPERAPWPNPLKVAATWSRACVAELLGCVGQLFTSAARALA